MTMNAGMPEQAREQLNEFLGDAVALTERRNRVEEAQNLMLAKGLAMQQAAILPPNFDIEDMVALAGIQVQLEGLFEGH